jgi:hypothetical protein
MSNITSCCANESNNAWVVMNNKLYGITDFTQPAAAWNLIETPRPVIQVSCGSRYSGNVGIVTDDYNVWVAKKNIITIPEWVNTGITSMSINLFISGTDFTFIGGDNEQYRKKGDVVERLPRPASGAYPIVINDYCIGWNAWGTFLGNDGKIYYESNMYNSAPTAAGWWTARTPVDVPGTTHYVQQDNGKCWIVQNGQLKFSSNAADKVAFVNIFVGWGKLDNVKLVCSNNHGTYMAIRTDNTVVWGENNEFKGTSDNNLIDLNVSIPAFIASNPYASLTNSLSNPRVKDINTLNSGPQSYIQKMAKSGITDFTPFKLLTLNDLANIGKANKVVATNPEMTGNNQAFSIWVMTFDSDDPYLPVSDVIIKDSDDINQVLCVLVKNDSLYSTPISSNHYKEFGHSLYRHDDDWTYTWNFGPIVNVLHDSNYYIKRANTDTISRNYNNTGYYLIGDIFVGGNQTNGNAGADGNPYYRSLYNLYGNFIPVSGLSIQNVNTTAPSSTPTSIKTNALNRPFVALKPQYLVDVQGLDPKNLEIMNNYKSGNNMKSPWWKLYRNTPFNTFIAGGSEGELPTGFQYCDFLPSYLIASVCGNGKAKSDMGITNNVSPVDKVDCQSWMDNYMKMNNYENMKKTPVADWCELRDTKCDDNLAAFCTLGPNGQIYTKKDVTGIPSAGLPMTTPTTEVLAAYPNSILDMCGCFIPTDGVIATDYNLLIESGMSPADAKEYMGLSVNAEAYINPACYDSKCNTNKVLRQGWKLAPGGCRPVQICYTKSNITNTGTITGNVNIKQDPTCIATAVTAAAAPPPAAPTNAAPVSTPVTTPAAGSPAVTVTANDRTNVSARQFNIQTQDLKNEGDITGDISVEQQIKAEQTVIASNVDPNAALKAEEERKRKAKEEDDRKAKEREAQLKKAKEEADAAAKKKIAAQGPKVVPPPPKKAGLSTTMIIIIIAVLLALLGGGAFLLL